MKMKGLTSFLLLVTVFISCEENFSPKAEFEEEYILTCIIGAYSPYESISPLVEIFHTYDVDGFDPGVNIIDPILSGAEVSLEYSNENYFYLGEDTLMYRVDDIVYWIDSNRYGNPRIASRERSPQQHKKQK